MTQVGPDRSDRVIRKTISRNPSFLASYFCLTHRLEQTEICDVLCQHLHLTDEPQPIVLASSLNTELSETASKAHATELLSHRDVGVRRYGAASFFSLTSENDIEILLAGLGDEDLLVRQKAIASLGQLKNEQAVESLLHLFRDGNELERHGSCQALTLIGGDKVSRSLCRLANHDDADVRNNAVRALGAMKDRSAIPTLIERLDDGDRWVQKSTVLALADIGSPDALEPLISSFSDSHSIVRHYAAVALAAMPAELVLSRITVFLRDPNNEVRQHAVETMGMFATLAVEPLLDLLKDDDPQVRRFAAKGLANIGGHHSHPALIEALQDDDPQVIIPVCHALADTTCTEAANTLIRLFDYDSEDVRNAAAIALGKIGSSIALEQLVKCMLNDIDLVVRSSSAEALGRIEDERAVLPLIEALDDKEELVRRRSAEALGQFTAAKAEAPLRKAFNNLTIRAQYYAIRILATYQSPLALETLRIAIASSDKVVRRNAVETLGKTDYPDIADCLLYHLAKDPDPLARSFAASALARFKNSKVMESLCRALEDKISVVRQNSCAALGKIGFDQARPYLAQSLTDCDWRVRRAAALALAALETSPATTGSH